MADIKSFREIAMEKIAAIEEASEEEQLKWKYIPEGEKLAASCLIKGMDIISGLEKYDDKLKPFVVQGADKVFISNINLPKNDILKENNEKAMNNLLFIKKDKKAVTDVFDKIKYIFEHYNTQGKQQKEQSYELLKNDFQNKVEQALAQKVGAGNNIELNIESLPQFQEEWSKVLVQIDSQYISYLNEYKQNLKEIK